MMNEISLKKPGFDYISDDESDDYDNNSDNNEKSK